MTPMMLRRHSYSAMAEMGEGALKDLGNIAASAPLSSMTASLAPSPKLRRNSYSTLMCQQHVGKEVSVRSILKLGWRKRVQVGICLCFVYALLQHKGIPEVQRKRT